MQTGEANFPNAAAELPAATDTHLGTTSCEDFLHVTSFGSLIQECSKNPHRIMHHDDAFFADMTPAGLRQGINVFGDGDGSRLLTSPYSKTYMRSVFTFAIDRGIFLPSSTGIVDSNGSLVEASVRNTKFWGGLEYIEREVIRKNEQLYLRNPADFHFHDVIAVSPLGVGKGNYGHFLFDGLPAAYLLISAARLQGTNCSVVVPQLKPWQREIFTLLGWEDSILEVERPTIFKTLISNSMLSLHVQYTTRYARPLFDALKFAVPTIKGSPEKIFILRPPGKRTMRNLDTIRALAEKAGYVAIQPELFTVREQIELFSRARYIIGQAGAAMANICFAPPGAKVLEIMPDSHIDQWTRSMSYLFGHQWHLLMAKVDDADRSRVRAGGAVHAGIGFTYNLSEDIFLEALSAIGR